MHSSRNVLHPELTVGEWMSLASHGDRSAYRQIVSQFQDRLYNSLVRLVSDPEDAAELTHQTFKRGLSRIAEFPADADPYTWLFGIATNLVLAALRQSRRRRPAGGDRVASALERLDPDYRVVLVMRDIERFDYRQMSAVLALPPATVESRLFRARLALRDELKD